MDEFRTVPNDRQSKQGEHKQTKETVTKVCISCQRSDSLTVRTNYKGGGVDIKIYSDQCYRVAELIDQKRLDKSIFGNGYLISDSAAAELKAAELKAAELKAAELKAAEKKDKYIWKLYPSEKEIIKHLR